MKEIVGGFRPLMDNFVFTNFRVDNIQSLSNDRTLYLGYGFIWDESKSLYYYVGGGNYTTGWEFKVFTGTIPNTTNFSILNEKIEVRAVDQGTYKDGDIIPKGSNITDILTNMLRYRKSPEYTAPTFSITTNLEDKYYSGDVVNLHVTTDFQQNDAGDPVEMNILQNGESIFSGQYATDVILQITLTDSVNSISASISHEAGVIYDDSFGDPDEFGRIQAGTIYSNAVNSDCDYPIFYMASNSLPVDGDEISSTYNKLLEDVSQIVYTQGVHNLILAIPFTKELTRLYNGDATYENITDEFDTIDDIVTIQMESGEEVQYSVMVNTIATPYTSDQNLFLHVKDKSKEMHITIKVEEDDKTLILPILDGYGSVYDVDWGDGGNVDSVSAFGTGLPSHTYDEAGTYKVVVSGVVKAFSSYVAFGEESSPTKGKFISIDNIGNVGLYYVYGFAHGMYNLEYCTHINLVSVKTTNIKYLFTQCIKIERVHADIFKNGVDIITANSVFENSGLAELDDTIFRNCVKLGYLNSAFRDCGLTIVPRYLFKGLKELLDCSYIFSGNKYMTGRVENDIFIDNSKLYYFRNIFYNTDIYWVGEDIFQNIDTSRTVNAVGIFAYCSYLTEIPENIFKPLINLTTVNSAFKTVMKQSTPGYTIAATIPENIFKYNGNLTNIGNAFGETVNLTNGIPGNLLDPIKHSVKVLDGLFYTAILDNEVFPKNMFVGLASATSFYRMFYNATGLIGTAEPLWEWYPDATGTDCFTGCTALDNYEQIPTEWGGLGYPYYMELEVEIPSNGYELVLPIEGTSQIDWEGDFDWSDSEVDYPTHVFNESGLYTIRIGDGIVKLDSTKSTSFKKTLVKINKFGVSSMWSISFSGCEWLLDVHGVLPEINSKSLYGLFSSTGIQECPKDLLKNNSEVTNLQSMFYNSKIRSIDPEFFKNCVEVTTVRSLFNNTPLQEIPEDLFRFNTKIKIWYLAFINCKSLESIPNTIFKYIDTTGVDLQGVFKGCTKLTLIPEDLLTSNPNPGIFYNLSEVFNFCTGLLSIPPLLLDGLSSVVTLTRTFAGCSGVSEIDGNLLSTCTSLNRCPYIFQGVNMSVIPEEIFRNNVLITDLTGAFYNIDTISHVPGKLFETLTRLTTIEGIFTDCQGITSVGSNLFDNCTQLENVTNAFWSNRDLKAIPDGIFKYNTKLTTCYGTFGNCNDNMYIPLDIFENCNNITSLKYCFTNYNKITQAAPELWETHPNADGEGCFEGSTSLANYNIIPEAWGGLGEEDQAFVFTIKTTTVDEVFTLPTVETSTYDYYIDWGDNTYDYDITAWDDRNSHTYAVAGTYQIKIRGEFTGFRPDLIGEETHIVSVESYGNVGLYDMLFKSCGNLTTIPDTSLPSVSTLEYMFYACGINSVPETLLQNNTNKSSCRSLFQNCDLEVIPEGILYNMTMVTDVAYMFSKYGSKISDIPENLFIDTEDIESLWSTFYGLSVETIPDLLFKPLLNLTSVLSTFQYCLLLKSVSSDIFKYNTHITDISFCFAQCYSLHDLGSDIFQYSEHINNISSTFYGCRSLKDIPERPIMDNIYASNCFINCTELYGEVNSSWWEQYPDARGTDCFTGCTNLDNYEYIPEAWGGGGKQEFKFTIKIDDLLDNQFILPTNSTYSGIRTDCMIFWGDGTSEYSNSYYPDAPPKHYYSETGEYQISIRGTLSSFFPTTGSIDRIIAVNQWGTDAYSIQFRECTELTTIPSEGAINPGSSGQYVFYGCSKLVYELTPILFDNNRDTIKTLYRSFGYCTGVTGDVSQLFRGMTSLESIPQAFLYTSVYGSISSDTFIDSKDTLESINGAFQGSSISEVSDNAFEGFTQLTNVSDCFNNCVDLTTVGENVFKDCTSLADSSNLFKNSGLTSFPNANIFEGCTSVTTVQGLFYGCSGIVTDIPVDLLSNLGESVTDARDLFAYCESVTGQIPDIMLHTLTGLQLVDGCFSFCYGLLTTIPSRLYEKSPLITSASGVFNLLGHSMIGEIPNGFFANCPLVTSLGFGFQTTQISGEIPEDLFINNVLVINVQQFFNGCTQLAGEIPSKLLHSTTKLRGVVSFMLNCPGLTGSIPADMFRYTTECANFSYAFEKCTGLSGSIPYGLFDHIDRTDMVFTRTFRDTNFTGVVESLWERYPDASGTDCFTGCTQLDNYESIPESWGGSKTKSLEFTIELSDDLSFKLQLSEASEFSTNLIVEWGDGESSVLTSSSDILGMTHSYSTPGTYDIILTGDMESFDCRNRGEDDPDNLKIIRINQFPNKEMYKFNFGYCSNLKSIPAEESLPNAVNFYGCFWGCNLDYTLYKDIFKGCTKTETIGASFRDSGVSGVLHEDLFKDLRSCVSFERVFFGNAGITGNLPANIFKNNHAAEDITSVFGECGLSGSIPGGILDNTPLLKTVYGFPGMQGIGAGFSGVIPGNLYANTPLVKSARASFYYLEMLEDIESGLHDNNVLLEDVTFEFMRCAKVSAIPWDIYHNCSNLVKAEGVFNRMYKVGTIPTNIFSGSPLVNNLTTAFFQSNNMVPESWNFLENLPLLGSITSIFRDLFKITTISEGVLDNQVLLVTSDTAFRGCVNLDVTGNIFRNCVNLENVKEVFYDCRSIESIEVLFDSSPCIVDISYAMYGCVNTTVNTGVILENLPIIDNVQYLLTYCRGVNSVDEKMLYNNVLVTNLRSLMNYTNIETISSNLLVNNAKVTNLVSTFANSKLIMYPNGIFNSIDVAANLNSCFENNYTMAGETDQLWDKFNYGKLCFGNCTNLDNYSQIPTSWGGLGYPEYMELEITTTTVNQSVTIPITGVSGVLIDWMGNGNFIDSGGDNPSMIYSTPGVYNVRVGDGWEEFDAYRSDSLVEVLTRVLRFGIKPVETICLRNCELLTEVYGSMPDTLDLEGCFWECTSLKTISPELFSNCTRCDDLSDCFYLCSALESIPVGLFDSCTNSTEFDSCFSGCSSIISIPAGLFDNCTLVEDFGYCFYGCSNLESIPSGLFDNTSAATSFSGCFTECTSLKSIPSGLFTGFSEYTSFGYCFYGCSEVEQYIDGVDYWETYQYGSNCFTGCTKVENYRCIPADWGGLGENCNEEPFHVEFTVVIDVDNTTIDLPVTFQYSSSTIPCVDWGDDSGVEYDAPNIPTHTFTSAGTYIILVYDYFNIQHSVDEIVGVDVRGINCITSVDFGTTNSTTRVGAFVFKPFTVLESVYGMVPYKDGAARIFAECVSLKYLDISLQYCVYTTGGISELAWGCTSLETMNISGLEYISADQMYSIRNIAYQCTSLITFSISGLDWSYITDYHGAFGDCTSLTDTVNPDNFWLNSTADSYSNCFDNCTLVGNYSDIPIDWGGPIPDDDTPVYLIEDDFDSKNIVFVFDIQEDGTEVDIGVNGLEASVWSYIQFDMNYPNPGSGYSYYYDGSPRVWSPSLSYTYTSIGVKYYRIHSMQSITSADFVGNTAVEMHLIDIFHIGNLLGGTYDFTTCTRLPIEKQITNK